LQCRQGKGPSLLAKLRAALHYLMPSIVTQVTTSDYLQQIAQAPCNSALPSCQHAWYDFPQVSMPRPSLSTDHLAVLCVPQFPTPVCASLPPYATWLRGESQFSFTTSCGAAAALHRAWESSGAVTLSRINPLTKQMSSRVQLLVQKSEYKPICGCDFPRTTRGLDAPRYYLLNMQPPCFECWTGHTLWVNPDGGASYCPSETNIECNLECNESFVRPHLHQAPRLKRKYTKTIH